MTALHWSGIGALAAIAFLFYFVRRIPVYVGACAGVVVAFAAVTVQRVDWGNPSEWLVMTVGLMLCIFGLLIVRVMLIRSVSLHLLGAIDRGQPQRMGEDIGGRLHDMRAFRLIQMTGEGAALTPFGRVVSGVISLFYSLFRIA